MSIKPARVYLRLLALSELSALSTWCSLCVLRVLSNSVQVHSECDGTFTWISLQSLPYEDFCGHVALIMGFVF